MQSRKLVRNAVSLIVAAIISLGILPALQDAEGQYFGRNKVQYRDLDFSIIKTEHFDIYYPEGMEEAATEAARMSERWYARLSRLLDHDLRGRQPVVLYGDHPSFQQTNAVPTQIGEGTGGLTEFLKRRIVMPLGGSGKASDHVLGHELVHAFQFDLTGQGPSAISLDVPLALRMPLWFIEGMAEYLSVGTEDSFTAQWLRGAIEADALPSFRELSSPRFFPYRYGHAFWSYVAGKHGDQVVGEILKESMRAGGIRQAMLSITGIEPDSLVREWHQALRDHYEPVLEATEPPETYGRELLSDETVGSELNLAPVLSPDGSQILFTSQRDLFGVEIFVADAETGEVKRKLTETTMDPHFESLQFLSSSGSWSPDGERVALAAVIRGRAALVVMDPESGDVERRIRLREVGEIFNPTWGPEGRRVAFTAQTNGYFDLYILDLETRELTRLTDDHFAQIHPNWSPDGSRILFATDRFTSDSGNLRFGDYRLATIDLDTREVEELPAFEEGKHIDPQWGPDGREVFFLSDRNGVTNVYRLELDTGEMYQVTNLTTGVSGITAVSPAISVARDSRDLAFTVHGKGTFSFSIYTISGEESAERPDGGVTLASVGETGVGLSAAQEDPLAGERVGEREDPLAALNAAVLPPTERALNQVDPLLADADLGLVDPVTFDFTDYSAALSLDFIGQPNLAVGADQFGFFLGGGGSAFFSDMLGDRNLATLLQVEAGQGKAHLSSALLVGYENRSSRWNWGVTGAQLPIVDRFFNVAPEEVNGFVAQNFQDIRIWQVNREITGRWAYPFNRAQRVEFSAGMRNIEFAANVRETVILGNRIIRDERRDLDLEEDFGFPDASSINLARTSAALVYDNAIQGPTAPVRGQRYRFEVSPNAGTITYWSGTADYRRYFMPVFPFTLATRGLHFGRYGGGSDDARLRQLFLGNQSLVRGYRFRTFDGNECQDDVAGVSELSTCPVLDQLRGTRVGVFNAEARLPILGGIGLIPAANVPPIELIGFFDAGVAWNRDEDPTLFGGDRGIVRSVGGGARTNLFGLLVLEAHMVNPLDRPRQGWFFDLNIVPGF